VQGERADKLRGKGGEEKSVCYGRGRPGEDIVTVRSARSKTMPQSAAFKIRTPEETEKN